jgi:uncharacterized repeat protein (TIGR01451 family)
MKHAKYLLLLVVLSLLLVVSVAQEEETALPGTDTTYVWSTGVFNVDKTVFYSVTVGVGPEDLNDVTVTATLPEGATFVAESWMPEGTTFVGINDNGEVTWNIPQLVKETFAGPFTFQVEFGNSDAEDFEVPAALAAALFWSSNSVQSAVTDETIAPLAETGTVEITPEGTTDLVPVGETGIWILVPPAAIAETVNLTMTRITLLGEEAGPDIEGLWWCGQITVTADVDVTFTQPIMLVMPTRRAVTPLMVIPVFTQTGTEDWVLASEPQTAAEALVGNEGDATYVVLTAPTFSPAGLQIAIGTTLKSGATTTPTLTNTRLFNNVVVNHEESY